MSDSPMWKRGKRSRSKRWTRSPTFARTVAEVEAAGSSPVTATSGDTADELFVTDMMSSSNEWCSAPIIFHGWTMVVQTSNSVLVEGTGTPNEVPGELAVDRV